MKAVMICLALLIITACTFGGYLLGEHEAKKAMGSKVLNGWFWDYEGRPQIYRSGFIYLPKVERDSLYQDAMKKL